MNVPLLAIALGIPPGWQVAGDEGVPDGDPVGEGTLEADLGCDGSTDTRDTGPPRLLSRGL